MARETHTGTLYLPDNFGGFPTSGCLHNHPKLDDKEPERAECHFDDSFTGMRKRERDKQ